jgi:hypothetical protein
MRSAGKITLLLLFSIFLGRADAATEWVKLYRCDTPMPEWIKITTNEAKGQVVGVYDNAFTIDVGTDEGARIGGLYLVYSERIPHKGREPLAALRVIEAAEDYSLCRMTNYVSGRLVRVGDRIVPAAVSSTLEAVEPAVIHQSVITEGFISQGGPSDGPVPSIYQITAPAAVAAPVAQAAPVTYAAPQVMAVPAPAVPTAAVAAPVVAAPAAAAIPEPIQYNYPPAGAPAPYQVPAPYQPQTYPQPYPQAPQAQPQPYSPPPVAPAPVPVPSPFPGNVTYPPYPNYQNTGQTQLEFDANKIADARLIRTLPLTQPDMNSLEIQFRGGMQLFAAQRYYEAFESFMRQTSFPGNYLSPYWAGMSALKIGDAPTAINLFNNSLAINPYYEPARNALVAAQRPAPPQPAQTARPPKSAKRK